MPTFEQGSNPANAPISYRKYQLIQLAYLIKGNMSQFEDTLKKDMGRPVLECRL